MLKWVYCSRPPPWSSSANVKLPSAEGEGLVKTLTNRLKQRRSDSLSHKPKHVFSNYRRQQRRTQTHSHTRHTESDHHASVKTKNSEAEYSLKIHVLNKIKDENQILFFRHIYLMISLFIVGFQCSSEW